jgi:hypothetical protein
LLNFLANEHSRHPPRGILPDMDSSVSEEKKTALGTVTQFGDLKRCGLLFSY